MDVFNINNGESSGSLTRVLLVNRRVCNSECPFFHLIRALQYSTRLQPTSSTEGNFNFSSVSS
jgi:hypothetical protein